MVRITVCWCRESSSSWMPTGLGIRRLMQQGWAGLSVWIWYPLRIQDLRSRQGKLLRDCGLGLRVLGFLRHLYRVQRRWSLRALEWQGLSR